MPLDVVIGRVKGLPDAIDVGLVRTCQSGWRVIVGKRVARNEDESGAYNAGDECSHVLFPVDTPVQTTRFAS